MKNFLLKFLKNIPLMLISLLLAIFVWIIAITNSDPTEEGRLSQPTVVEMRNLTNGLVLMNDLPNQVLVNLRAPSSIWRRITLEKPSAKAVIDVAGLEAGEYELPINIEIGISPVQVVSYSPQTAKIVLEKYETRSYPLVIHEKGSVPTAFKAELPTASVQEVEISGPVSSLDSISQVEVLLDHANATETIESTLPVYAVNENGREVKNLTISPEKVSVSQEINLRGGYRVLSVKLTTTGEIAKGFRVKNIGVQPSFISIYCSDRAKLEELNSYVETEAVNLSEISENTSKKIKIKVPDGITVVGDPNVNLVVEVEAVEGTSTITDVPVYMIGLDDGLKATLSPELVDVYVTGPINSLDEMSVDNLYAVVELQDLSVGNYQIVPKIEIRSIENISVQSILPAVIEVQISEENPETE